MTKLTKALNEVKIYNDYDIVSKGNPILWYRPISHERGALVSGWLLSVKGKAFKSKSSF